MINNITKQMEEAIAAAKAQGPKVHISGKILVEDLGPASEWEIKAWNAIYALIDLAKEIETKREAKKDKDFLMVKSLYRMILKGCIETLSVFLWDEIKDRLGIKTHLELSYDPDTKHIYTSREP